MFCNELVQNLVMCFVEVTWFEETNHTFNFDDGFVRVKCFEEIDHTFEDDPRVTTIPNTNFKISTMYDKCPWYYQNKKHTY